MTNNKYSVCLYGTSACGFTYLLGVEGGGLVATSGPGSDFGVKDAGRGKTVETVAEAITAALKFVPAGSPVCVHAPSGAVLAKGEKRADGMVY